jgi:VIT1/CCC1 family predicted Fe2+/Mn2+ transporter
VARIRRSPETHLSHRSNWLRAAVGDTGARLGGAPRLPATLRVLGWGALAMAATAGIGALVGTAV